MDKLILGRYVPGNSIIHQLDPRSKLLSMILFLCVLFWANNWVTNIILFSFVFTLILLSRISISFFIKGLRPMLGLILFTTLFQVFFIPGTTLLVEWGIIKITLEGLQQAGIIFSRFLLIIFFSTLLTLTTTPLRLADGIEAGLGPLAAFRVPVHEIGLMLSMSLRFVPTLMDDATRIMNAQRARGVEFNEGNLMQRVKAVVPILIPLFASSFKRADALAIAMEARGYQGGEGRTKFRVLKWSWKDTIAIAVMLVVTLLLYLFKS